MAKSLLIVESPAKSKTISKFLGSNFRIESSMGHIRDLPKSKLGVDVENNFEVKYTNDRSKTKITKILREAAKEAKDIYLAADPDREGEAIAWHLTELLKKEIKDKPVYRVIFNEITQSAVQKAVQNPLDIDMNMVDSQQARRVLDRLVGYGISPLIWRVIYYGLSAGRVQSVALRIICEREELINAFVSEEYWEIFGFFGKSKYSPFKAKLVAIAGEKAEFVNKEQVDDFLSKIAGKSVKIANIVESERQNHPFPPFITSTLQRAASTYLGFSAKRTMSVAQRLYEGIDLKKQSVGLITYMRTDSVRMSEQAVQANREFIVENFGQNSLEPKPRYFQAKKGAQDAHEAIRPTDVSKTPESIKEFLTSEQFKLYELIWQRFVATQMKPAVVKSKKVEVEKGDALFEAQGGHIVDPGFTACYRFTKLSLGENIDPAYSVGDNLDIEEISPEQKFTTPPARYTESSLIKELESNGIGRPSTYANILSTIQDRGYVELQEKKFYALELGVAVNNFLVGSFDSFFNTEFTSAMESDLDEISRGKLDWKKFLKIYNDAMCGLMDKVNIKKAKEKLVISTKTKCPDCGKNLVIKWGRNGQFLTCSNYPTCKFSANFSKDSNGKIVIEKEKVLDDVCPECGSKLTIKKGRFGEFVACTGYPNCKFSKPLTLGVKCPECGVGEITQKMSKKGIFYACTEYPKCKFATSYKPIPITCPECGNPYMELRTKKGKEIKVCPKCGQEVI